MVKVVSYSASPYKSINLEHIEKMDKTTLDEFKKNLNEWDKINELHIIGNKKNQYDNIEIKDNYQGVYYNQVKSWVLILCDSELKELSWIDSISSNITCLDVRFLEIEKIDVRKMLNLKKLVLSHNFQLSEILNLQLLSQLNLLDINYTKISKIPDLNSFQYLKTLNARCTYISTLTVNNKMMFLKYLDITNTRIVDISFIVFLPHLERLSVAGNDIQELPKFTENLDLKTINLSGTSIENIPPIGNLEKLNSLNLAYTLIKTLKDTDFPSELRTLVLEGTAINEISPNIISLKNLRKLILHNMVIKSLPKEIMELNLDFNFINKGFGICLFNTVIEDMDMSILEQPRSLIKAWFANKDNSGNELAESNLLNEAKVVFLGDGGSGKSLTIERLLINGEHKDDFDGESTPGISIKSKYYHLMDKSVLIHFWDFGGQEIMHSMHRMFLTKRTLYVVFVNARDNTQDERARYWLHNLKNFANDSPVIIVLNQIDQNPSASVNEPALYELYPNLKKIIKLSATSYDKMMFNITIENSLTNEIINLPYVREPFLDSWKNLKIKLQNMEKYYIDSNIFHRLCDECNVDKSTEVRLNLLEWFGDLGISFCYRDSVVLSNYMVLKPEWITNAIYIILFNGSQYAKNGLISHEIIHKMLQRECEGTYSSRAVTEKIKYSSVETEYVLGVIRKFRLSYRLNDEVEFIPMLCERNDKKIAKDFVDNHTLEFTISYEYLPNNVLHRLMVELRNDLLQEYVWLTGAVFSSTTMGLSALVKSVDNSLNIYVKSSISLYPPSVYLGFIRNVIKNINSDLGLTALEKIVYKSDLISEEFDYEYLLDSYSHGNQLIFSRLLKKNIDILDILNQVDGASKNKKNQLVKDIHDICFSMQSSKLYWSCFENDRNTYVRDMLRAKSYFVADQTLCGKSTSGISSGELDLEIFDTPDIPIAIYEGLNLTTFNNSDKQYWGTHLSKLLDNYNPMGLPVLFLVSYVSVSKDKYKDYWLNYYEYLSRHCDVNYTIQNHRELNIGNFYIRSAECNYDRAGIPTTVYHLCVRIGD